MLGYETLYSIRNFGALVFILLVTPLLVGLVNLIGLIPWKPCKYLKNKVNEFFFWNGLIGFMSESFINLLMCAFLNLKHFKWDNLGNSTNSAFTVLLLLSLVAFLAFVSQFYHCNFHKVEDNEKYAKFHKNTDYVFVDLKTSVLK